MDEIQGDYGIIYHRHWFNEDTGEVFCLVEAPNKEPAEAVHRYDVQDDVRADAPVTSGSPVV